MEIEVLVITTDATDNTNRAAIKKNNAGPTSTASILAWNT
jgi:hypothetical protein